MTEEEKQLEAEKELAEEKAKEKLKSVDELTELLQSTRSEAKQRRLKERELEEQIATMKAKQKEGEEAKLIEDGKLQELVDSKSTELLELQAKLVTAETVAEEAKTFKAAKVEDAKKKMGSKWLDGYANLSLTELDALVNLVVPKKVGTDNGADGDKPNIELTADQKTEAYAKYPHISPEKAEEYHLHNLIKSGKIKEK